MLQSTRLVPLPNEDLLSSNGCPTSRLLRHFARRWVFKHVAKDAAAYSAAWAAISAAGGEQEEGLRRTAAAAATLQSTAEAHRALSPPPVWARGGGVVQRLPSQGTVRLGNCTSHNGSGEGGDFGTSVNYCGVSGVSGREELEAEGPAITNMHTFFGQAIVVQVISSFGGNLT
jgi:hypothetical protein